MTLRTPLVCSLAAIATITTAQHSREYKSGIVWPEPAVVTPGKDNEPPSDAIVLFDGKDLSKWDGGEKWIVRDGYASPSKGDIKTKDKFGDCQLHLEFATPAEVKGSGQGRGHSGVFLMDRYEVENLDSYRNTPCLDGLCTPIYNQHTPLANVFRRAGTKPA